MTMDSNQKTKSIRWQLVRRGDGGRKVCFAATGRSICTKAHLKYVDTYVRPLSGHQELKDST